MKIKKALLMGLSLVLVAVLAIGGTVAYLTDTDSAVNVMTVGNVQIKQNEWQRAEGVSAQGTTASMAEGTLVPFVQGQPAVPSVVTSTGSDDPYRYIAAGNADAFKWGDYVSAEGSANGLWYDDSLQNEVDKIVTVTNTGKTDAYFRTIFAFELPEGMTISGTSGTGDFYKGNYANGGNTDIKFHENAAYTWKDAGVATIDGVRYQLAVATPKASVAILKAGETSRPSLMQFALGSHLDNEDVAKFGDTYDILVLSQAVQSAGFANANTALDTAFGAVAANAAEWFGADEFEIPVVVSTADELAAALVEGAIVYLEDGNYTLPSTVPAGVSIIAIGDGANVAIAAPTTANTYALTLSDNVTLKGLNIADDGNSVGNKDAGLITVKGENVVIEGCSFDISGTNATAVALGGDAVNTTIKNCDFVGGYKHIGPASGTTGGIVIDGCSFTGANSTYAVHLNATQNDVVVKNSTIALFNTYFGFGSDAGALIFENCDFVVEPGKTNVVKLYRDADFINCDFEEGFLFSDANKDIAVTFEGGSWGDGTIKEHFLADSFSNNVTATFDGEVWYWNTTTNVWTAQ